MAATRKLQGEIDRCLKKVSEGVETFEDIWQKVHNATNTNQKEKYEADLKKEIKKLQRLRDQIKSWIASGEIKDKSTLVDTRKLIETQMERFKVVERETKTKAYSKEGLGAAQKLDPTTREREELNNWLSASIDSMQLQIDQFECEIESILAAKKKRLDKDKQDRLDELKTSLERHRFHVGKLETLMRMLDNLAADVNALRTFLSQVKKIKDDIDYYLDSNQEPEFEENEFIYDDIEGLEEFDDGLTGQPAPAPGEEGVLTSPPVAPSLPTSSSPVVSTSGNNSPISPVHSSESSDNARRKSSDDISNSKVLRPVAVKANLNHSPSAGVVGSKGVTGTGTPNNSSPSSGLSNHVSSLSSLSSSPTHNYHNALNNSKSLSHTDSIEHNNSSTGASGALSKSPANNSNSIMNSLEGMSSSGVSINGIVENGGSPPMQDDHGSLHTQLNATTAICASSTLENGLISPPPLSQELPPLTTVQLSNNSTSLPSLEQGQQHQLFGDSDSMRNSASFLQQTFNGLANNFCDSTSGTPSCNTNATNLALMSNSSNGGSCAPHSGNNNGSMLSANVIGLTSSGNSALGGGGDSESANATTTMTTSANSHSNSTNSSSGVLTTSTNTNQSHNNSNTGLLSQHQIQLIHQGLQHMQESSTGAPPGAQASNNMDSTPISDYLRLHQSQGHFRMLSESDSMASLKSMAQDVLDRTGITLGDHAKNVLEKTAQIPPLLGVAPLGPVPLTKEHQQQFQMMDCAHGHVPVPADSERMRQFLPRNPYPTPHYYPQTPLSNSDSFEFFQRLSIETLFFIFYYLEGTKAQYLAAKVLKKQSWRFHTKYMMWFQRHEEPKVINDEYEQGTYVYFDIEKWGQRKKDGFVFEYRYLEDRDLG